MFGTVRFTPVTGNVVLSTPGSVCRIAFTFSVTKLPVDAQPATGLQTRQRATAIAVSDQDEITSASVSGSVTVKLAAPTVTDSDPDSPANNNSPSIKGIAPVGTALVTLYDHAGCAGASVTGTAGAFASPGFTVNVADDTSTTFSATVTDSQGGVSACSTTNLTYVEDSTPPVAPTLVDTDPDSPSNVNTVQVKGVAAANTTVRIYTSSTCTSAVAATGTAADFASPGLAVTVAANTTTAFYATATDTAGNASACSATSVTYVEDSTDPASPVISATSPPSPANNNTPRVTGSAPADATVAIYTNSSCSGPAASQGTAAAFASPGIARGRRRRLDDDDLRALDGCSGQRLRVRRADHVRRGLDRAADHDRRRPRRRDRDGDADVHVLVERGWHDVRVPHRPGRVLRVRLAVHDPGARARVAHLRGALA